jgi:hypothetical protein
MADVFGPLRTEIIESQKARTDLLKWKIVLISALGAVGFGIGKDASGPLPAVLGFIPIVCAYVDLLCVHNDLRILVIGGFLRERLKGKPEDSDIQAYEEICQNNRCVFLLESFALVGATVLLSSLIALMAYSPDLWGIFPTSHDHPMSDSVRSFLGVTGVSGLLVSVGALIYKKICSRLRGLPAPCARNGSKPVAKPAEPTGT